MVTLPLYPSTRWSRCFLFIRSTYFSWAWGKLWWNAARKSVSMSTPARMSNPFAWNPTLHPPPQQHRSRTVGAPFPGLTFPIPALAGDEEPELERRRLGSPAGETTA
eukprot:471818-Prymnesium_polylepis.1